MKDAYIGLDIGGMSFKGGVIDLKGNIIAQNKSYAETDCKNGKENFLVAVRKLIIDLINEAKEKGYRVKGIGAGVPGFVDNKKGIIEYCTNLRLFDVELGKYIKDLNLPLYLSNDANVAALGEQRFGVAKGYKNVVMVTIGTGIGSGIIIDDKLYEGNLGQGAEIGHMVIVSDGKKCNCGRRGCFERYASARALLEFAKSAMKNNKDTMLWELCDHDIKKLGCQMIFNSAKEKDPIGEKIIEKYIHYLGEGLLNICNIFRPECIVIGGGIANQKNYLLNKVNEYLKKNNYGIERCCSVEVKIAKLINDAGIVGAACLCF